MTAEPEAVPYFIYAADYPDEGSEVILAVDEKDAQRQGAKLLNYDDPDDIAAHPASVTDLFLRLEKLEEELEAVTNTLVERTAQNREVSP